MPKPVEADVKVASPLLIEWIFDESDGTLVVRKKERVRRNLEGWQEGLDGVEELLTPQEILGRLRAGSVLSLRGGECDDGLLAREPAYHAVEQNPRPGIGPTITGVPPIGFRKAHEAIRLLRDISEAEPKKRRLLEISEDMMKLVVVDFAGVVQKLGKMTAGLSQVGAGALNEIVQ